MNLGLNMVLVAILAILYTTMRSTVSIPMSSINDRVARFLFSSSTTTVVSFTSTFNTTVTSTTSCYVLATLDANNAIQTGMVTGVCTTVTRTGKKRKRRGSLIESRPTPVDDYDYIYKVPVEIDGVQMDWSDVIHPHKTVSVTDKLTTDVESSQESIGAKVNRTPRIFSPIVFLTRLTSRLNFTSITTITDATLATAVTFFDCTPSDLTSIIPSQC